MSVTSVHNSIDFLTRDIVLKIKVTKSLVRGEYVTTDNPDQTVQAALLPTSRADQRLFPEGTFTLQDRTLYSASDLGMDQDDIVEADGKTFKVFAIMDRLFEGGFIKYFLKKDGRIE